MVSELEAYKIKTSECENLKAELEKVKVELREGCTGTVAQKNT